MRRTLKFSAAVITATLAGAFVYTLGSLAARQGGAAIIGLFILPHILAVLVLYAAMLAFVPTLVMGTTLFALARIGPAMRTGWFWAGSGGIVMIVLFPYLESFGRDPASGWTESASAVLGGMLAMLGFRGVLGIEPGRSPIRRPIEPSLFIAAGLLGVLLVGAIGLRAAYDGKHRSEVRPAIAGMSQATADMAPVYVTLHEYTGSEADPQYMTTGRSLTMRFARSYLSDVNAQAGGALKEIRLHVRKDDFAPLGAAMAQRNRGDAAHMRATDATLRRIGTDVTLSAISGPTIGRYASEAKRLLETPSSDLGERCGLRFASKGKSTVRAAHHGLPSALGIEASLDLVATVQAEETHGVSGLHCYAHLENCSVQFSYRGFPGLSWISKSRICEWDAETRRLFDFLDDHLVRQADPRPGA